MNLSHAQAEEIPFYGYEFEGIENGSNMTPEEKYGYTVTELQSGKKELDFEQIKEDVRSLLEENGENPDERFVQAVAEEYMKVGDFDSDLSYKENLSYRIFELREHDSVKEIEAELQTEETVSMEEIPQKKEYAPIRYEEEMNMNLSHAQRALCEELGIKISEETEGEYVLTINDSEILRGDETDISEYLERMVEAQNTIAQEKTGAAIRNLREENKISVREFAYSVFKTPEEMELIENGKIRPDSATINLIGNMFGVSASALKEGKIEELTSRSDIQKLLKNIEKLLTEIRQDNAEMKEFIRKWNLTEDYGQSKQEKAETETVEEQQKDVKTADESISRYTVIPKSATVHTSGEEKEDGYYVVVDTYTGEVVTDLNGMEQQFTSEAAALAYALVLEKQSIKMSEEPDQNVETELQTEQSMENEPEQETPAMKMKM